VGNYTVRRRLLAAGAGLVMGACSLAIGPVRTSAGYGGGASNDTWQVALSFNCDSPTSPMCEDQNGNPSTGGFWAWVEFDAPPGQPAGQRSGTGDGQFTGCGHTVGGGGAGAGHFSLDITAWHEGPAGPNDPGPGDTFYLDHYIVTFAGHGTPMSFTDAQVPDFRGDLGVPITPGHYSFHRAPGVAGTVQVSFRPAH